MRRGLLGTSAALAAAAASADKCNLNVGCARLTWTSSNRGWEKTKFLCSLCSDGVLQWCSVVFGFIL